MLRPFIVIGFLSAATGAFANPVPLASDDLKALSGSLVELDTPLGTKLPIRFGTDGLVSAEAGELAPLLGSAKDRGRWWVDGNKLCSKFFRWFEAEVRCITVAQEGSRLFWRQDNGETGTATLVEGPTVKPGPVDTPAAPAVRVTVKAGKPPKPAVETAAASAPEVEPAAARPVEPAPRALSAAPSEPAPVVVARAAPAAAGESLDGVPMMRFGGAGLLEASSRVGTDAASEQKSFATAALPLPTRPAAAAEARGGLPQRDKKAEGVAKPTPSAKPAVAAGKGKTARSREGAADAEIRSVALYRVQHVRRFDVLNVRRGPSETHAPVAAIPFDGRRVEMTGLCEADWCPIRYGRVTGWVHSFYLAEEGTRQDSASRVYRPTSLP